MKEKRRAITIIIQWTSLSGRRKQIMKEKRDTTNTHHIYPLNKPNVRGFKLLSIEESETQHKKEAHNFSESQSQFNNVSSVSINHS